MLKPESIVTCRTRDWVLLRSDESKVYLLRPLTGATDEVAAVHKVLSDLITDDFSEERVRSAKSPPPTGKRVRHDVLDQLLAAQLSGQRPADVELDGRRNLTDEIASVLADTTFAR